MLIRVASVTRSIERSLIPAPSTGDDQAATPSAGPGLAADAGQLLAILSRPQAVAFAEAPVPGAMLAAILATARQITPLATHHEPAVYAALADPGTGTGGVYRTSASGALADRIAGHDVLRGLHQIYTSAPALLLICGTVTGEPRLHQGALMSAAALGYSEWLAARHHGLDGSLFPDASALVTAVARADSSDGRRHLFTVALGQPASHAVKQRQEVVSLCISAISSAVMATGTPPGTCGSSKRCGLSRLARTLTSRRPVPAWNT